MVHAEDNCDCFILLGRADGHRVASVRVSDVPVMFSDATSWMVLHQTRSAAEHEAAARTVGVTPAVSTAAGVSP